MRWVIITPFVCLTAMADTDRERTLEAKIEMLEKRLEALEAKLGPATQSAETRDQQATTREADGHPQPRPLESPGGIDVSAYFDGNYTWNVARPSNRINLLRAYDVLHINFNINQTGIVIERAPDVATGRRFGMRLDLMYGQATETVQGGTQNELRPQLYRPVFRAYGSYVVPAGRGLNIDFGKFAGALGYEGNYTKDQFTYSRAFFFTFLPFYHMGFRSTYEPSDRISLTHWLVNGAQQTEDFNGFKSNAFLLNIKPASNISWNINYYFGREGREYIPVYNPELPEVASQPGLPLRVIRPAPDGRFHVLDSYASWEVNDQLALVVEADYIVNRTESSAPPSRVIGGAAYAAWRFNPSWRLATRFEYLDDRHGLFSGVSQALKENTLALTWEPRRGFQFRGEWRRDYSNQQFFISTPRALDGATNHGNGRAVVVVRKGRELVIRKQVRMAMVVIVSLALAAVAFAAVSLRFRYLRRACLHLRMAGRRRYGTNLRGGVQRSSAAEYCSRCLQSCDRYVPSPWRGRGRFTRLCCGTKYCGNLMGHHGLCCAPS